MIIDDLIAILEWIDEHEPSGADVIQELSILGPRLREFRKRFMESVRYIATDYPNIEEVCEHEMCWAIDQSVAGVLKANDDMHAIAKELRQRLGMNEEEYLALADSIIKRNGSVDTK